MLKNVHKYHLNSRRSLKKTNISHPPRIFMTSARQQSCSLVNYLSFDVSKIIQVLFLLKLWCAWWSQICTHASPQKPQIMYTGSITDNLPTSAPKWAVHLHQSLPPHTKGCVGARWRCSIVMIPLILPPVWWVWSLLVVSFFEPKNHGQPNRQLVRVLGDPIRCPCLWGLDSNRFQR